MGLHRMKIHVCVALLLLAACSSTVSGYWPGSVVTEIDGIEYAVKKFENRDNTWTAVANRPTGQSILAIQAGEFSRNIRAIERVSGCTVDRDSVKNTNANSTIAAVVCE